MTFVTGMIIPLAVAKFLTGVGKGVNVVVHSRKKIEVCVRSLRSSPRQPAPQSPPEIATSRFMPTHVFGNHCLPHEICDVANNRKERDVCVRKKNQVRSFHDSPRPTEAWPKWLLLREVLAIADGKRDMEIAGCDEDL